MQLTNGETPKEIEKSQTESAFWSYISDSISRMSSVEDESSRCSFDELTPLLDDEDDSDDIHSLWSGPRASILFILCTSIFITYLPESLLQPFFPLYSATELGFSHEQIAIILSLPPLFGAMFTPLAANLSMKYGRIQVWMSGSLLMVITMAVFGFTSSFPVMCVIRMSQGLCVSLVNVSTQSIVTAVFRSQKATAMSAYQTSMTLAFTLGPTLGGLLFDLMGFELLFVTNSFIALISFLGSTYLYFNFHDLLGQATHAEKSHTAFRDVLTYPTIYGSIAWALLYSGFAFQTLLQEHLYLTLRLDPTGVGITIFFQAVTTVLIVKPVAEYTDTYDARFFIPWAFVLCSLYWVVAGPFMSLLASSWWGMLILNCLVMVAQGTVAAMLLPTVYSYLAFQVMKEGVDGTEEQVAQIMVFLEGMGFTLSTLIAGGLMSHLPRSLAPGCTFSLSKCETAFSFVMVIYGALYFSAAILFSQTIVRTDYRSQLNPKMQLHRMSSLRCSSTPNVLFGSSSMKGAQGDIQMLKTA